MLRPAALRPQTQHLPPARRRAGIAVFGALVAHPETFLDGLRVSLLIAALLLLTTTAATLLLLPAQQR